MVLTNSVRERWSETEVYIQGYRDDQGNGEFVLQTGARRSWLFNLARQNLREHEIFLSLNTSWQKITLNLKGNAGKGTEGCKLAKSTFWLGLRKKLLTIKVAELKSLTTPQEQSEHKAQ